MRLTAQLKCLYSNARSIGDKQEELEAAVEFENYDLIAVMDTWWDGSHHWNTGIAGIAGYELFRRAGRKGGAGALPSMLGRGLIAKSCL